MPSASLVDEALGQETYSGLLEGGQPIYCADFAPPVRV